MIKVFYRKIFKNGEFEIFQSSRFFNFCIEVQSSQGDKTFLLMIHFYYKAYKIVLSFPTWFPIFGIILFSKFKQYNGKGIVVFQK